MNSLINDLPEDWFDVEAREGEIRRFRHPGCSEGKDKALTIIKTKWGWYVSCFRCKQKGVKAALNLSPDQVLRWQQVEVERENEEVPEIKLPGDYLPKVPAEGLAWLYSCGITDNDIKQYYIGFSPHRDRVILPMYEGDELVYWQGRYLGEPDMNHPKYTNQRKAVRHDLWFKVVDKHSDVVVVVEDILSCIVVGKVVDCYALLNASVPDRLMWKLSKEYKRIVLWLDPDKHGAMDRWSVRYQSFGINVSIVKSDQDPKYYSKEEIRKEIRL